MAYVTPTSPAVGDPGTAAWADQVATDLTDSGFTTPSLGASWVATGGSTGTPKYCVHAGVVYITGGMKSGTGSTVFTLPVGMRPLAQLNRLVSSASGAAIVTISAAGALAVSTYISPGSNAGVNLEISFIAEQ